MLRIHIPYIQDLIGGENYTVLWVPLHNTTYALSCRHSRDILSIYLGIPQLETCLTSCIWTRHEASPFIYILHQTTLEMSTPIRFRMQYSLHFHRFDGKKEIFYIVDDNLSTNMYN